MRGVCSVWAVFVGGLCGIGLGVILASDLANTHTLLFRCALSLYLSSLHPILRPLFRFGRARPICFAPSTTTMPSLQSRTYAWLVVMAASCFAASRALLRITAPASMTLWM